MMDQKLDAIRLTEFAHGGGCGCKLAPSVLSELLSGHQAAAFHKQLLVGIETGDDAAVWQLDASTCIIATTDFFMPMVDDPFDFGRVAATNAISDVYAMGGKPIFALAILGMPLGKIPPAVVRRILDGGQSVCADADIPIAGGHSIDAPEPIYGLAVTGICKPENIRRNNGAQPGDALILTKPIGVGIYSAAFKKGELDAAGYDEMIATTTLLNKVGTELGGNADVHAITDVTGFGLLGHAGEMARGSNVTVAVVFGSVPLLSQAEALAQLGFITGASGRNWESYSDGVEIAADVPVWRRQLLTDPQTSGGLLVSCADNSSAAILQNIKAAGFPNAAVIGYVKTGAPRVSVQN